MSKEVSFSYIGSQLSKENILKLENKLIPEIRKLNQVSNDNSYSDERSSINLPDDKNMTKQVKLLASKIKKANPAYLVIVGIGGSNLGTMAVESVVLGKLSNDTKKKIKTLYADTVDSDEMTELVSILERSLKQKKRIAITCISKSGTTTETIANFEILLKIVSKYDKKYKELITVITDYNSPLEQLAKKENFNILSIPKQIGGRYSVLSPVGLFPLEIIGVNTEKLLKGASLMKKRCLNKNLLENPAALSAIIRYLHANKGNTIQDLFLFGNDFKSIGKWYRQLFAESLGKGCDIHGQHCIGITPIYSIGTADMHSIAQLYLGGPYDKLTTFVHLQKNRNEIKLPDYPQYEHLVNNIQNKSISYLMEAIYQGVKKSFSAKLRPYTELNVPDKSEHSVGQLLQLQMVEAMYLGALLNVNPFDQPDIESYKEETKRILAKK